MSWGCLNCSPYPISALLGYALPDVVSFQTGKLYTTGHLCRSYGHPRMLVDGLQRFCKSSEHIHFFFFPTQNIKGEPAVYLV